MPQANRLTLHILAAVAEHERQMISERTKAALAAAKARGTKLGAPYGSDTSAARAERTRSATAFRDRMAPDVKRLAGQGLSLPRIAAELNRQGSVTSTGKAWYPAAVWRVLASRHSAASAFASPIREYQEVWGDPNNRSPEPPPSTALRPTRTRAPQTS